MPEQLVRSESVDRAAVVVLNRPGSRNALSGPLLLQLAAAMAAADANPDVDAIVLTGADPVFSAGVDLKAYEAGDPQLQQLAGAPSHAPWPPTTKPVIGAVNGAAITGGLELALHCDLLVASERATFVDTHVRFGLVPCWGLTVLLPAAVGIRTAIRMSLTSEPLGALDAHAAGLVMRVVGHDELLPAALETAAEISRAVPDAARAVLASYRAADRSVRAGGYDVESATSADWHATHPSPSSR